MKTVEFRDGERDIPEHLALLMKGMNTWEMTFEQARDRADVKHTQQALQRAQNELIQQHFKKRDGTA